MNHVCLVPIRIYFSDLRKSVGVVYVGVILHRCICMGRGVQGAMDLTVGVPMPTWCRNPRHSGKY